MEKVLRVALISARRMAVEKDVLGVNLIPDLAKWIVLVTHLQKGRVDLLNLMWSKTNAFMVVVIL